MGRGGVSVCLTLHIVYSTLIFIDVCMGEGAVSGVGFPKSQTSLMFAWGRVLFLVLRFPNL